MGSYDNNRQISDLLGVTLTEVNVDNNESHYCCQDVIVFIASTGDRYEMYHDQDCCESVGIDEIIGDLSDLVGNPILLAESVSNNDRLPGFDRDYGDSHTWTFYKLSTIRGSVTIRWFGTSNGYYSESVSFKIITQDDEHNGV